MRLPNSEVIQANRYKFDTLRRRETFTLMERISLVSVASTSGSVSCVSVRMFLVANSNSSGSWLQSVATREQTWGSSLRVMNCILCLVCFRKVATIFMSKVRPWSHQKLEKADIFEIMLRQYVALTVCFCLEWMAWPRRDIFNKNTLRDFAINLQLTPAGNVVN